MSRAVFVSAAGHVVKRATVKGRPSSTKANGKTYLLAAESLDGEGIYVERINVVHDAPCCKVRR